MHAAASRLKRAQCQRDGQRLPDRLLRDCRWRCCLTILVSGCAGAGGSGSDRPLPNLRSTPPSLELGLCPLAEPVAPVPAPAAAGRPVEDFPPWAGLPAAWPDPLLSDAGLPPAPARSAWPLLPAEAGGLSATAPDPPAAPGLPVPLRALPTPPPVVPPGFGLAAVRPVRPAAGAGLPAVPPIGTFPPGPIAAAPTGYLRSRSYCWPRVQRFVVTQYRTRPNCQYRPVSANSGMM